MKFTRLCLESRGTHYNLLSFSLIHKYLYLQCIENKWSSVVYLLNGLNGGITYSLELHPL